MPLCFDERSGIVDVKTPWGRWWQTVSEVFVEVDIPSGTPGRDCKVLIQPKHIECRVKDKVIFKGNIYKTVHPDESTWSVEDRKKILILLEKSEKYIKESENAWVSLLEDQFVADPLTQESMSKKLALEKFQIDNPGFDFSAANFQRNTEESPYVPSFI